MRNIVMQCTSLILLLAVGAASAVAQYGGGMGTPGTTPGGYTAPKGGYGSSGAAIGIGVGAAAAGAGLAYWALHKRPDVVGCVQPGDDGNALMNEKDGKLYSLQQGSDVTLKPGERVALKGKKTEQNGKYSFQAHRLVKDYGACDAKTSSAKSGPGPTPPTAQAWAK